MEISVEPFSISGRLIASVLIRSMRILVYIFCGIAMLGCSAAKYEKAADREVYEVIAEREGQILGSRSLFNIDTQYAKREPGSIPPGEIIRDRLTDGSRKLTLPDALGMAVANNREYQLEREQLYLSALQLTGTRHEFAFRVSSSSVDLGLGRATDGALKGDSDLDVTLSRMLTTGGRFSATLANDLVLYFSGKPKVPALTLSLTQPLLRGAGAEMAAEVLTQAERDVVYAIRDYSHYQKSFAINTVTDYFRLLQAKDSVRNSYNNYINLQKARDRAEALAEAERLPRYQVDQARQKELSARVSYLSSVESYRQYLDSFKQHLGLPLGEALRLDDAALDGLKRLGLPPLDVNARAGYVLAIGNRLDVMNTIDRFEDSKRKVRVAANDLQPGLDILADVQLEDEFYSSFDPGETSGSVGLKLDLPLDQLPKRNAYRSSRIHFEKELRTLATSLDTLRDDIREGVRALEQERENYGIQQNALKLAEQRVTVMPLLLEADESDIRDQLEAQADLVSAQNALTRALVNYHVARWNLLKNLGLLDVKEDQFWLRRQNAPGVRPVPTVPADGGLPGVDPPDKVFGN